MAGTRPRAAFDTSRMKCASSSIASRPVPRSASNAALLRFMLEVWPLAEACATPRGQRYTPLMRFMSNTAQQIMALPSTLKLTL